MSSATSTVPSRDACGGIRALVTWASNPVSARGATQVFRFVFAYGGPTIARIVERMRQDPDGRRLLEERPDLGAALNDMETLAVMPEGSLGRSYHDFMGVPEVIPGYVIAGLIHQDGAFDRLEWDDDMKFVLERLGNTHDLTHVLSGYGTDLAAEAINISFGSGFYGGTEEALPNILFGAGTGLALLPRVGLRRRHRLSREALDRGLAVSRTRQVECVPFEELLAEPLEDVRAERGVPPLRKAFDSSGWVRSPIGKRMADGFGKSGETGRQAAIAKRVVEAGVPVKFWMQASEETKQQLVGLVDGGAGRDELRLLVEA